jgi:hypothetical protein
VLFVLLVIVVVTGALAASHIDTREFFPIHLDLCPGRGREVTKQRRFFVKSFF